MKTAQVGERVTNGTRHGEVKGVNPWTYMLRIRWDDGCESRVHQMYVEPSRVADASSRRGTL